VKGPPLHLSGRQMGCTSESRHRSVPPDEFNHVPARVSSQSVPPLSEIGAPYYLPRPAWPFREHPRGLVVVCERMIGLTNENPHR